MALKIYKKGAYVVINNSGKLTELNSANVSITKDTEEIDIYEVKHNGVPVLKAQLSDILDENGVAYVEAAWDIFRYEQTGSVNSSEVANPYPAPSTITVNITPTLTSYSDGRAAVASGILAMGSTPIELLPAPGVGLYYDIEKIVLEYAHVSTAYTSANNFKVISSVNFWDLGYLIKDVITNADNNIGFVDLNDYNNTMGIVNLNEGVKITFQGATNPTLGDGTLRAIITYTVRTFGA